MRSRRRTISARPTVDLDVDRALELEAIDSSDIRHSLRACRRLHRLRSVRGTHLHALRSSDFDGAVVNLNGRNIRRGLGIPSIPTRTLDVGAQLGVAIVDGVLNARLSDPGDHPRGTTVRIDPAPLRVLGLRVLVVTAAAVVVTGAIPVLVAERKCVRTVANEDLAELLADHSLLKTRSRPPGA